GFAVECITKDRGHFYIFGGLSGYLFNQHTGLQSPKLTPYNGAQIIVSAFN
ncbi:MAG: hypothetical protein ACI9WS_003384, partial [Paraglaciecola psychrophila]